jgi:hypothetical protein
VRRAAWYLPNAGRCRRSQQLEKATAATIHRDLLALTPRS